MFKNQKPMHAQKFDNLIKKIDLKDISITLLSGATLVKWLGIFVGVMLMLKIFAKDAHGLNCYYFAVGIVTIIVSLFQSALIRAIVFALVKLDQIAANSAG